MGKISLSEALHDEQGEKSKDLVLRGKNLLFREKNILHTQNSITYIYKYNYYI
jgi:hypothetical protein